MRNKRLQVYCSTAFFMYIFSKRNELSPDGELARNIFSLFKHSQIYVEADTSETLRQRIPTEVLLAFPTISFTPGKLDFDKIVAFDKTFFERQINPSALLFLDSTEDLCQKIEDDFGLISISREKVQKAHFLFNWHLEPVFDEGNNFDWRFLSRYKHPHNALIICDNYLFAELLKANDFEEALDKRLRNDIVPILTYLMPGTLHTQIFELTFIFTQDKEESAQYAEARKKGDFDSRPIQNLKIIAEKINQYLVALSKECSMPSTIKISIIKRFANVNKAETHDRHILTNYMWINSGYGFGLGSLTKKFNTTIKAFPVSYLNRKFNGYGTADIDQETDALVWQQHCELLNVFKNIQAERCLIYPRGAKSNRLISGA